MATFFSGSCGPGNDDPRSVIPELGRWMYSLGWATSTGGSISMRSKGKIFVSPSGVMKETIQGDELFTVSDDGDVIDGPPQRKKMRPSGCTPLFTCIYQIEGVGASIHSHSPKAVMATILFPGKYFHFSNLEPIKGVCNCRTWTKYQCDDTLIIPIIENTTEESFLHGDLQQAIADYPDTCAVLIRRHGLYVWGRTWVEVKCMAECYEYIFDIAIEMKKCGLMDPTAPQLQPV